MRLYHIMVMKYLFDLFETILRSSILSKKLPRSYQIPPPHSTEREEKRAWPNIFFTRIVAFVKVILSISFSAFAFWLLTIQFLLAFQARSKGGWRPDLAWGMNDFIWSWDERPIVLQFLGSTSICAHFFFAFHNFRNSLEVSDNWMWLP